MRRLLSLTFLLCALLSFGEVRVLTVGISKYPSNSGWSATHANRDVALMKNLFPQAVALSNSKATFANIISNLDKLKNQAQEGDTIIVHFSGHGQRIITARSSFDTDYVDEAFVPFDARKSRGAYDGKYHLTNSILGSKIIAMREAVGPQGLVMTLLDACHSNSDVQGDRKYRGTDQIFGAENLDAGEIEELEQHANSYDSQSLTRGSNLGDVVLIGACKSNQSNRELDKGYGSLTYYFCKSWEEGNRHDVNSILSTLYGEMTQDQSLNGQTPVIRNTLGWVEPNSDTIADIDKDPIRDHWTRWLILGAAIAIIFAGLFIWLKKRKTGPTYKTPGSH